MRRITISSGAKWEALVGYSRAVRMGNIIEVSGTAPVENGAVAYSGNAYAQTVCVLRIIEKALREAGAAMSDVVRTRIYVTNMANWEEIGRAHGEFFRELRPATTLVEVSALIDPDILVEIEATAIVEE